MSWVRRWVVELPPVRGIITAVIFASLFGVPSIILATPLMVVVKKL